MSGKQPGPPDPTLASHRAVVGGLSRTKEAHSVLSSRSLFSDFIEEKVSTGCYAVCNSSPVLTNIFEQREMGPQALSLFTGKCY